MPRIFLAFSLLLASFNGWGDGPLHVVTTIKPIHSIISGLMEGTRSPDLLIDQQSIFDHGPLSNHQQQQLQRADLFVWVGPELESFLANSIGTLSPRTVILTLLDNPEIKVLQTRGQEKQRDPYFWLDSRNMIILADELAKALMRIDPERTALYQKNRQTVLQRLSELDRGLEYGYRGLKSGIGMAYYDTLQYFEQAYALKIRGVVTTSPTTPVSGLSLLQNRAKLASGIYSCMLTETGMPTPELGLLTDGVTLNIGVLDSLGTKLSPGPELYYQLMEHNTKTIKTCLRYEEQALLNAPQPEAVTPPSRIGGKFMLRDHHGRLFTDQDMHGKLHLIYFGYTFCPDVCPTSLITLSSALNQLGEQAEAIQPYFITVDPARDTAEALKTYVSYFHPSMIGLTGTQAMTDRVAKLYRVKYERVIDPTRAPDQYIIDHSSGLYLMAPDGTFITKFAHGLPAPDLASRLREYISRLPQ